MASFVAFCLQRSSLAPAHPVFGIAIVCDQICQILIRTAASSPAIACRRKIARPLAGVAANSHSGLPVMNAPQGIEVAEGAASDFAHY
jgi:hypothetical protein